MRIPVLVALAGLSLCLLASSQEVRPQGAEALPHGYSRKGNFIYFDGQRIDLAGRHDIEAFSLVVGKDLTLCSNVDAATFTALSEQYSKDSNAVYYKWISPGRFWVVELPDADPATFEVIGFNLARDQHDVYWYGAACPGVDAGTVEVVNDGFVWKDQYQVWYQHLPVEGADPATFEHLEQAFYRDARSVFWSNTRLKGADPSSFRTFGEDSAYGADDRRVWRATIELKGVDARTFSAVHQSIFKDRNGVYSGPDRPIRHADPKTFRKIADLDEFYTALFADAAYHYIYLPYRGEVFRLIPTANSLRVDRLLWKQDGDTPPEETARSSAELAEDGWIQQRVFPKVPNQEAHLLKIYESRFKKAWDIIRNPKTATESKPKP